MAGPGPLILCRLYIMHIIILSERSAEGPRKSPSRPPVPLERLVQIMRRLRDPVSGCEWDQRAKLRDHRALHDRGSL